MSARLPLLLLRLALLWLLAMPAALACPAGTVSSGGECIDLTSDRRNCGAIGDACSQGQLCSGGTCSSCPLTRPTLVALSAGDALCVDLQTDSDHCGRPTNRCTSDQSCRQGACACPPGTGLDGSRCVDLYSDPDNCGRVGNTCPTSSRIFESYVCSAGSCTLRLDPVKPYAVCGGAVVNTDSSPRDCGSCGNTCSPTQVCTLGRCGCPAGLTDITGSCIDTQNDSRHCGGPGRGRADGERCSGGFCVRTCALSEPDVCYGECIDLQDDPKHCGSCGNVCSSSTVCQEGTCVTIVSTGSLDGSLYATMGFTPEPVEAEPAELPSPYTPEILTPQ